MSISNILVENNYTIKCRNLEISDALIVNQVDVSNLDVTNDLTVEGLTQLNGSLNVAGTTGTFDCFMQINGDSVNDGKTIFNNTVNARGGFFDKAVVGDIGSTGPINPALSQSYVGGVFKYEQADLDPEIQLSDYSVFYSIPGSQVPAVGDGSVFYFQAIEACTLENSLDGQVVIEGGAGAYGMAQSPTYVHGFRWFYTSVVDDNTGTISVYPLQAESDP